LTQILLTIRSVGMALTATSSKNYSTGPPEISYFDLKKVYKQTDGLAMRSPIGPLMSNVQ